MSILDIINFSFSDCVYRKNDKEYINLELESLKLYHNKLKYEIENFNTISKISDKFNNDKDNKNKLSRINKLIKYRRDLLQSIDKLDRYMIKAIFPPNKCDHCCILSKKLESYKRNIIEIKIDTEVKIINNIF